MATSSSNDDDHGGFGLPYESGQLAALLEVMSVWSSGSFIHGLAAGAGVNLDATSIVAVTLLARDGDQRASTLAARLRIGASAISKLSNRLGSLGLVEKVPDPRDSRASLLRLTPAGFEAARALVRAGDVMMDELVRHWPDDDRAHFDRLLRRFRDEVVSHAVGVRHPSPPQTPE